MAEPPWLTIVGIGADGGAGLTPASQAALAAAEVVIAPPRHLALVDQPTAERIEWPVPFADGIEMLKRLSGRRTVALVSGDPFWFGAGVAIAKALPPDAWVALPAPSTFSHVAAHLGWPLQSTHCLGLHAAPVQRIRRHLAPGVRMILLLRDGEAPITLAQYLTQEGFSESTVTVFESVAGSDARVTVSTADALSGAFRHPVCAAIEVAGHGAVISAASGRPDDTFLNDGQITKRPIRAITLSTLAPKPLEHLWDIGSGSGSIAIEWLMSHRTTTATSVEARSDRAARIRENAARLGVEHRLTVVEGTALDVLPDLAPAQAIFVGGGLTAALLDTLSTLAARLVANVVTLEGEALLAQAQAKFGGDLMRIALSHAKPLGPKTGWNAAYPVVQWSLDR